MSDEVNREESLFEEALQQSSPAERAAFLDRVCQGDPRLRARLETLLEGHFQGRGFLERTPGPAPAMGSPEDKAAAAAEELAEVIGHYRLLEKVGEGGFGAVYVAEQREPVRRRVALKILKLGMDTRQVVARFEAERQALALMDHPHIAKVLEAGATKAGRPYFVMELVRGIRITDYCDQHHLPTRQRLDLFRRVCHAIQHAHQKGIIHRDIKPSNVLITLHDGVPVPKVIDFGIAKATQGELTDKTVYTQLHQFVGTPAYMSPEQADMSGLEVDARSDIYSLGVLLYELLTGSTPFDTKELLESGLDEMRRIIREREPMRPSTRIRQTTAVHGTSTQSPPATRHSSLPTDLDWIVMKCLEKDRTRRYDTVSGLAQDIEHHLNNEPVVARPPAAVYRIRKFIRRNQVMVGAAVVVMVAVLATVAGTRWWLRQPVPRSLAQAASPAPPASPVAVGVPAPSVAVLPFVNLGADKADEYLSDGISDEILSALSRVQGLKVPARTSCFAFKGKSEDIQKIGRELRVSTVLEGSMSRVGDQVHVTAKLINLADGFSTWSGTYDRALDDLLAVRVEVAARVAEALKGELLGAERQQLAKRGTESAEAYRLCLQGRYLWNRRTAEDLKQAIGYFNQAIAKDPGYAIAYAGLADCYDVLPFYTGLPRLDLMPKARAAASRALELDNTLVEPRATLADIRGFFDWDWSGAEAEFRRVIALNPNYATAHQWLGNTLESQGRFPEALAEYRLAQEIDPLSRIINANAGFTLLWTGEPQQAIEALKRQVALDPSFAVAREFLGFVYLDRGDWSEAIGEFETMRRLDASRLYGLAGLGFAYARAGRTREAQNILDQAVELQRQGIDCRVGIAIVQHALGDDEGALDSLEKALAEHAFGLDGVNCYPFWKDLRPHPRVQAILKTMNLVPAA